VFVREVEGAVTSVGFERSVGKLDDHFEKSQLLLSTSSS
jgi:hypothetical protein